MYPRPARSWACFAVLSTGTKPHLWAMETDDGVTQYVEDTPLWMEVWIDNDMEMLLKAMANQE